MPRYILTLTLTAIAFAPFNAPAQPAAQQAPVWTMGSYQIDWRNVDSLTKMFRAYNLPAAAEAKKQGVLLDYRILIHRYAGRANVIIMQKYSNFAAIGTDTSIVAAFNRMLPDTTRRRTVTNAYRALFGDNLHNDGIYVEVTP